MKWVFLLAIPLLGCGHEAVQKALVTVPVVTAPTASADPDAPTPSTRRWLVTPDHTRFQVRADGPLVGEQRFEFEKYRAHITTTGLDATFDATIDVNSIKGPFASVVRDRLLEAQRFPEATFHGTAHREAHDDGCTVDGRLTIHGITKNVHFQGTVREMGDKLHVHALFEIPRSEFDIAFHDSFDAFLPEDVRVLLDLDARPETAQVEQLPTTSSPTGE